MEGGNDLAGSLDTEIRGRGVELQADGSELGTGNQGVEGEELSGVLL